MSANLKQSLGRLNSIEHGDAEKEFLKCCGSEEWAKRMLAERPFESFDDLLAKAERVWWLLAPSDWLEAFHSHPKIGEKQAQRQVSAEAKAWSDEEQSSTGNSADDTKAALAELNGKYEDKFGYIFIVYATGKTSEEMLAILRRRLANDPEDELQNAAAEQAKITQLRLKKLVII